MDTIGQHAVIGQMESLISRAPGGGTTFFDLAEFPWVPQVEAYWKAMRDELQSLMAALDHLPGFEEIQSDQVALTNDKRWKIFPLFVYGQWLNSHRCPSTTEALRCIPDLKVAMFSILQPRKELPPHRGPYSGVLRYHLGIKVPHPEQCAIRVRSDVRHWEEGRSMIFDDSHDHAAWNRSDDDRIVLFVDFARPLPPSLKLQNDMVIEKISQSDFVVQAAQKWQAWESRHGSAIDAKMGLQRE